MLSIAVMKSAVGLFKDLAGMVNERRKHDRESFERICTPLYEKLELVAKEYHGIFAHISAALSKKIRISSRSNLRSPPDETT